MAANSYRRLRPGPGQARLDVIASQRARLQRAIIELAAREGAEAVTVRKLTRLARVSTGSFYARYTGTDDCMLRTYEELMAAIARQLSASRSVALEPRRQVEVTLRAMDDQLRADRDAARFMLIEAYGGGPAALATIAEEERRLESTLSGCLDRRGQRVPEDVVAAIVAAALHCFRAQLRDGRRGDGTSMIDSLVEWAGDVAEGGEDYFLMAVGPPGEGSEGPTRKAIDLRSGDPQEDLILTAVLRLASPDGFFGLSAGKISSAAGVPAARLRGHFASISDVYLAALRRTSRSFFAELTAGADRSRAPCTSALSALREAWHRALSDPVGASLTFGGIVQPGVAGLTCREALISELATAFGARPEWPERPDSVRAEARAAAVWAAFARAASHLGGSAKAPRGGAPRTSAGCSLPGRPSSSGGR